MTSPANVENPSTKTTRKTTRKATSKMTTAEVGADPIFSPLTFPSGLTVKNRVLRSNISERIDNYDGSGTMARVNWEEQFARGGVGAIVS